MVPNCHAPSCSLRLRPTHAPDSCIRLMHVQRQSLCPVDSAHRQQQRIRVVCRTAPQQVIISSLLLCTCEAIAKPLSHNVRRELERTRPLSRLRNLDYAISTTQSRHSKPQLPTSQPSRWSLAACRGHRRRSPLRRTHTRPREAATRLLLSHRQQTLVSSRGP